MQASIILGERELNQNSNPYIIAEIGVNHEGSIDLAKKLIDLAKEGGADAAKFQSYKANTLASRNSPSYWDTSKEKTNSQYELFSKYDAFGEKEFESLYLHCKENKIEFISTPFDHFSVDYLNDLMPFFKISSSDITNIPLLKHIANKKKPIILSTGASDLEEIDFAIKKIESCGNNNLALLHCILNYPTPYRDANLNMISSMRNYYKSKIIGYSDHTLPDKNMSVLSSAYLLGAVIIEKHFTHDKNLPGNDHYHAMDVQDLKNFKTQIKYINEIKGNYLKKEMIPNEKVSRLNARRSIVIKKDMRKGEIIQRSDLICKRPGHGISPIELEKIIGLRTLKDLKCDDILTWDCLEDSLDRV